MSKSELKGTVWLWRNSVDRKGAVSAGFLSPVFKFPGLCRQSPPFGWIFGLQSPHPKIPFLATEFRNGTDQPALGNRLREASFEQLLNLLRIQTTFDGGFDEVGCEERERDGHIDLTHAAFLARGDLLIGAACTSCHGYSIRF